MTRPDPTVVTPATLRAWPLPEPGAGKEARGRILVVGGTSGTPGAVLLAGEAALRVGAGKLQIATVDPAAGALAVAVPESLVLVLPGTEGGAIAASAAADLEAPARDSDAVLVGPGFCDPDESVALLEALAPMLETPTVVDALASAFLTEHPDGLRHLEGRAVLTVNPTELARTAGVDEDEVADVAAPVAARVAARSGLVVVCGGTEKLVVAPDGRSWLVQGGGPGLGVSGSGDVQAGFVAGLLARGADPAQAAVWGAYVHARAGERLAGGVGTVGYLAREIPLQGPAVLGELA
ncbi:MAG: NAD(P)H-hydrate dehydratase [Nocardioides sp.]|jgi:ADP-dependent NAD(P)H-hydrate dehydratase|nr:NAD(P)H-hydrate dehydratase [Nocardioides sp.]